MSRHYGLEIKDNDEPVCPNCGRAMHLQISEYYARWECDAWLLPSGEVSSDPNEGDWCDGKVKLATYIDTAPDYVGKHFKDGGWLTQ